MSAGYQLRPATLDDVEDYVHCHVECLAETYATIMPAAFIEQQRRDVAERIADTRRSWQSWSSQREDATRVWLAREAGGDAVGIARSGPGPQPWESALGAPRAAVDFELHHIYTRARTHGTGLGQAMLELALAGRDAYLWILHGNARAERFYRRNGFGPDGVEMSCGPSWYDRPMFRMVRQQAAGAA